jgi:pimeloyl-ACP methyl ester carboxylesterase
MSAATQSRTPIAEKRTIGRAVKPAVRGLRAWLRVASVLAPSVAERHAAAIFMTPRTRRRTDIDAVPPGATRVHLIDAGFSLMGWEWGMGAKPVVLLVHGWSGLASDMQTMARELVDAGFRAIAFDMPAHGRSPGRRTSLVEWIRALHAIERWTGGIAGIVGHSYGATALTLALEERMIAPRAVLVSPAPGPMHYLERIRRFIGLPDARVPGMVRRLVKEVGREIAYFESTRAARSLELPALVIHDPDDAEVPWSHVLEVVSAWRGSRLETREGVGHYRILRDEMAAKRAVEFLIADR